METTADRSDAAATADPEEDGLSVRVMLSQQGERVWLRLKGSTLTAEVPQSATGSASTGVLALDIAMGVVGTLTADQTDSFTVEAEEVIVLPPRRRLTSGHLMALIPALLFGLVAVVVTIVSIADPHQSDLGLAAAFWILAVISLAPVVPFLLRGRKTARIRLGTTGPVIEFWYRPGSRKHRALDAFFVRLFQTQRLVDEVGVAALPLLWKGTAWESLDAPEEGSPHVRWLVIGAVGAVVLLGVLWFALSLTGVTFLALLGLLVVIVVVILIVRRSRDGGMRRAERLWDRGQYDAAADRLYRALTRRPRHQPAWRMLIEYCLRRGDFDAAFACCDTMEAQGLAVSARIRDAVARFKELSEGTAESDFSGSDDERRDGAGATQN